MTYLLAQASAHRIPLRDESVQTCVTSPPYWGLRAYAGEQSFVWGGEDHEHEWASELRRTAKSGGASAKQESSKGAWNPQGIAAPSDSCLCGAWRGALGLEPTPDLFVAHMVEVFREVRRVLRKDGTLWLNLGDSYASSSAPANGGWDGNNKNPDGTPRQSRQAGDRWLAGPTAVSGLKPKDLIGIPWRVAFALQADGWYLRSDIIWAKPNPMPESVTDRPTKSHEYVFLLSKSATYYYDADAIREPHTRDWSKEATGGLPNPDRNDGGDRQGNTLNPAGRNARSVWNIATQPYSGAHFATFPEELPERCIKAGSATGDVVLDPFNGSGTTGRVAMRLGRRYVGLDMSREYLVEQALARIDPIAAAARDFREQKDGAQGALL